MEMINVDELNYVEEDDLSPSRQMMETGNQVVFYIQAGLWGGEMDYKRWTANNNYRKMHGIPKVHRNKTNRRLQHYCQIKQYETEHAEEMTWKRGKL